MADFLGAAGRVWLRTADWIKGLVQDLPPEMNACETDCGHRVCAGDHWEECPFRLQRLQTLNEERNCSVCGTTIGNGGVVVNGHAHGEFHGQDMAEGSVVPPVETTEKERAKASARVS